MLPAHDRFSRWFHELANTLSHGVGLLAAIAVTPMLILAAVRYGTTANVVGASIFGATMILMYFTSTFYHALPHGDWKRLFQKFDHAAIYLLIAGTYTPFTLGVLKGAWGWSILGVIWALATIGVVLKLFDKLKNPKLSTGLYLAMGWLVVIAAGPLISRMPVSGLLWLAGGGLAYSLGVIFYVLDGKMRHAHAIWHGFVLAGTGLHVVAVMGYSG